MPIWHQSPKLTPRYFLETPRLFGYPNSQNIGPFFKTIGQYHYMSRIKTTTSIAQNLP